MAPLPAVATGGVEKNTRTPLASGVIAGMLSAVPSGCGIRLRTVTSMVNTPVAGT